MMTISAIISMVAGACLVIKYWEKESGWIGED